MPQLQQQAVQVAAQPQQQALQVVLQPRAAPGAQRPASRSRWGWHATSWIVLMCLVPLMVPLMIHEPDLRQPWRLHRCFRSFHSFMAQASAAAHAQQQALQFTTPGAHQHAPHLIMARPRAAAGAQLPASLFMVGLVNYIVDCSDVLGALFGAPDIA